MIEKYGFVYVWFDRKHKRYYVGSHWGTEDDGYICSSDWMKKAYKRRPADFKRRIIARIEERSNLLTEENRWIQMIKDEEIKVRYYNLNKDVLGLWHHSNDETRKTVGEKISVAKKGKKTGPRSEETKRKISETKKRKMAEKLETLGYKMSPEHIEKVAAQKRGKKHTDEHRLKISSGLHAAYDSGSRVHYKYK